MTNYLVDEKNSTKEKTDNIDLSNKQISKKFSLKKMGNIKSLVLILVLLIVAVVLYNSTGTVKSSGDENVGVSNYTTSMQYINEIETKLKEVISEIKGAGNVNVMISINSSPQLTVAENTEEKVVTTTSGTTTTTVTEPIIVKNNGEDVPLILKETLPEINGVVVVSSGASDIKVKLNIINAVSTVLGIRANKVEVFIGN